MSSKKQRNFISMFLFAMKNKEMRAMKLLLELKTRTLNDKLYLQKQKKSEWKKLFCILAAFRSM